MWVTLPLLCGECGLPACVGCCRFFGFGGWGGDRTYFVAFGFCWAYSLFCRGLFVVFWVFPPMSFVCAGFELVPTCLADSLFAQWNPCVCFDAAGPGWAVNLIRNFTPD